MWNYCILCARVARRKPALQWAQILDGSGGGALGFSVFSGVRTRGEIGIHARFRTLWPLRPWGFEALRVHFAVCGEVARGELEPRMNANMRQAAAGQTPALLHVLSH